MAGAWTTVSVKDGNGTLRTMRAWDESGTGAGPFSFASTIADLTGAGSVVIKAPSTAAAATDESLVTNESPNSQLSATTGVTSGAAVITDANGTLQQYLRGLVKLIVAGISVTVSNALAPGRKTPANSAPVVLASQAYNTVAASAAAQALTGGSGGAAGDWLDFLLIIPATTSPGAVSVTDGAGSAITVFAGGASSIASLVPFAVPIRAISASGAWKVTTGLNVSAVAAGNFT